MPPRNSLKPKLIPGLALVICSGWLGCSTPRDATTNILDYSAGGGSPVADEVVIQSLGKGFFISVAADSWPALIQKTKPVFAWNGCDLMWIENDKRSEPRFVLDEAYIYQPTNQPRQWVLVKDERPDGNRPEALTGDWWQWWQFGNCNLRAVAGLHDSKPVPDDSGYYGDYAVVKSTNQRYGVVYEIGWQGEMSVGNAHPEYSRRIYLFKDKASRWHFLGEGPAEGAEHGGWDIVEARVVWDDSQINELPLQIKFHRETTRSPVDYVADDTNRPPDEVSINDFVLAGKFPAQLQKIE